MSSHSPWVALLPRWTDACDVHRCDVQFERYGDVGKLVLNNIKRFCKKKKPHQDVFDLLTVRCRLSFCRGFNRKQTFALWVSHTCCVFLVRPRISLPL